MNSNEIQLSVKDFQIVKKASLTFTPGLTAIIGQSNNGKSALFRAAKSCIYNEPGTTSIRHGCNQYAVGIQMNGHTVIYQKGANSLYKVDNMTYQKVGRTQLPEVAKALGIKELNLNGVNEQINFWDQMEKPFLLDRSETELFRFIVDSGKDNNVTVALKTLTQDRQQITKDITLTEGKIAQLEENIKRQEEALKNSEYKLSIYGAVIELGPKIQRVNDVTNLKNKSISDVKNLKEASDTYNKLDDITTKAQTNLDNITNYLRKVKLLANLLENSKTKTESINELSTKLDKMKSLEIPDLNEKLEKYKSLSDVITKLQDVHDAIRELSEKKFPTLSEDFNKKVDRFTTLSTIISSISTKNEERVKLEEVINKTKLELDEVNKEINSVGVCPTCGQPLHVS